MAESIISVERLGKRYRIGVARHDTLRDRIVHGLRAAWHAKRNLPDESDFWALHDISFEVQRGEVLGVIGRNGAGKSTLLKILSRITEPTTGRISIRGRVASLLEVGTGFHPELTGRENVFLNGAILGMSRAEIRRKFDEIVAFAEVERFLDTPVKHYSSGMYVRLAFAVAAHLEPEILIVDEVLAVGDLAFQQKCLGRMEHVARTDGRTVLFVSHDLSAVSQLCRNALLLAEGTVAFHGSTSKVIAQYQSRFPLRAAVTRHRVTTSDATIVYASVDDTTGTPRDRFRCGDTVKLTIRVEVRGTLPPVQLAVRLSTIEGTSVLTTSSVDGAQALAVLPVGHNEFSVDFPTWLAPGRYAVRIALCEPRRHVFDAIEDDLQFEITSENSFSAWQQDDRKGVVAPLLPWSHRHFS